MNKPPQTQLLQDIHCSIAAVDRLVCFPYRNKSSKHCSASLPLGAEKKVKKHKLFTPHGALPTGGEFSSRSDWYVYPGFGTIPTGSMPKLQPHIQTKTSAPIIHPYDMRGVEPYRLQLDI